MTGWSGWRQQDPILCWLFQRENRLCSSHNIVLLTCFRVDSIGLRRMPTHTHILSTFTLVRYIRIFSGFIAAEQAPYAVQGDFDAFNRNAGNGHLLNGSFTAPSPDPTNVYVSWNISIAQQWLSNLRNKPTIVTIDNEMEIASNSHQDMHPQ